MYAKVFCQIFDSSIADNYPLRHFFMDLLVLADADGCVDMTPAAIAARTRIPLADVTAMLATLEQPDRESRTPDADGRRIERLDEHRTWGWHIINYARFRQIASEEQRKASQRERFQRWKSKKNEAANAPLTPANASNAMQRQKQKQMENTPLEIRKPSSTAERIASENKVKILKGRLAELAAATAEQWQRDAQPGLVTEKNQLRDEITALENSLL
jgi:hypothetical protein